MATPTNAADETNTAPSLDAYINLANYVYDPGNKSTEKDVIAAGYKPLTYDGKVVFSKISQDGFYGEAFVSTSSSQSLTSSWRSKEQTSNIRQVQSSLLRK